ncbi:olfactory receptor 10G6-like isoform X1 [Eublepharis macularius]|uniref:Olfactory receptor 10G6-like isoform X1 n=1 Tax=Eublepharis macularius TaxID=481883 RepID=A0AA97K3W6_EUBMA|nr:olfactory receptor 10G6-like isoform X1 [Eublepharis macularius]
MDCENQTSLTEFVLIGLPYPQDLTGLLFIFFLLIYLLTLLGNLVILLVVVFSSQLHKPMYWFLCHLSFLDMTVSSVVVPKVIAGFLKDGGIISFGGCVSQLFFFHFLGCTECFLYTVMAYDRFLAICKPLHYATIMNRRVCLFLAMGTWFGGCLHSMMETALVFRLPFGWRNEVNYIFCDIPAVLKLVCADTALNEVVTMVDVGLVAMTCFFLILTSYVYIVSTVLKIRSAEGRQRAFSTCTAHVTLVVTYYVPLVFIYLRPGSQGPLDGMVAVFYTSLTPLLNPIIYTLRNKDIKMALLRLLSVSLQGLG